MWGKFITGAAGMLGSLFNKKGKSNAPEQQQTVSSTKVNPNGTTTTTTNPVGATGGTTNPQSGFFQSEGFQNGISNMAQSGTNLMSIQSSGASKAVKQMQTGDQAVNMVADAVSMIPGFGTAIGVGMKLVNSIGGNFVGTPEEYKNFTQNQNVMGSSSLGGVASNASDAQSMIEGYKSSGLTGKLIGRRKKNRDKVNESTRQQAAGQDILTTNKDAFAQQSSSDMFNNRNNMLLSGYNTNQLRFGKNGMRIDKKKVVEIKKIVKAQQGTKISKGAPIITEGLRILNQDERNYWNGFVDYVDAQGFKGNPDLDSKDKGLSRELWNNYKTASKGNYEYDDFIPSAQHTIKKYRDYTISRIKNGFGTLKGYTKEDVSNANFDWDNIYFPGLSKVDGWAGSKTTSFKFPGYRRDVYQKENTTYNNKDNNMSVTSGDKDFKLKSSTQEENPHFKNLESFKNGGVLEAADNVIVDGALHARKHNLNELEHLKDAEITTKGVPVITMEEGGEIVQTAEVEKDEIIFCLEVTKQLEALMEDGSDEAKIKAGKLLTQELLFNTKDSSSELLED